ncbi:MAG: T9SS type A sorting domain-containing protein, partial [candidate division Zixibacteria bacterium]|nr:T9SS type A sorting domain-containing protein [candidate division Zixibacteria bacterium]
GTNEWYVTQYVPYTVPLGIYQYWAYCGDYDNRIIDDSCFFPFMVVLGSENHQNADSWDVSRWGSGVEIENPISTISAVNYPNPFNAQTTISYDIFSEGDVRLDIYNIGGQKVANLKDDYSSAGYYNVSWDASGYSSGIYIYRLTIGENIISGKMNLVK